MSSDTSSDQGHDQGESGQGKGTNPVRLIVLLAIFGLALVGLLYDYCIARPAIQKAGKEVEGLLEGKTPDPDGDGIVTADEVQSVLGRKPAEVEPLSNGKIEIYQWRSGLPYRSYKLWVVYAGKQLPLLHSVSTSRPEKKFLPPETIIPKAPTKEELENFTPKKPGLIAGPAMGGGQRKGGEKSGRSSSNPADEDETTKPGTSEGTRSEASEGEEAEAPESSAAQKTPSGQPDGSDDQPAQGADPAAKSEAASDK